MRKQLQRTLTLLVLVGAPPLLSCVEEEDESRAGQTIPAGGGAAISAWLATDEYKRWTCQSEPHPPMSPSPHGRNRVCANDLGANHQTGPYPVGTVNVKEIYDGETLIGHALSHKVGGGNQGVDWYWYESLRGSLVVDGRGDNPMAAAGCVACHGAAGSDAAHFGHDFVYTQLK